MMSSHPIRHQRLCCRCTSNNSPANSPHDPTNGPAECRRKACRAWEDMLADNDVMITRKSDWEVLCGPITFPGQAKKRGF